MPRGRTFPGRSPSHEANRDWGTVAIDEDLPGGGRERGDLVHRSFAAPLETRRDPVRGTDYWGAGLARWLYSNLRRRSSSSLGSLDMSSAQSFPTAIPLCTAGRAESSSNQRLKYLNSLMSWP